MEIIPVIDIWGGKVVRASGGEREHYPLLQSKLTSSCEPLQLIGDLLEHHCFEAFYLADLDAIENQPRNFTLYNSLTKNFPDLNIWIDAGIKTQQCWQQFSDCPMITPVIGSETLIDSEWLLSDYIRLKGILSLDFKKGLFLGMPELLKKAERWTERVIVMELDCVGDRRGPDINHLLELKDKAIHSQLIAAGGIRNTGDLVALENHGIKQALVASALHDGSFTISELK